MLMCLGSNAAEVGATSQMASLVSKIVDFSHILNAQLRLRGKAKAPFSVRLRGRVQFRVAAR